jgi:hypothetical protein
VQRGAIVEKHLSESRQEFEIKYREVYSGSTNAFTLVDSKKFVMVYSIDVPEEDVVLNQFDIPKLYVGYKAALTAAILAGAASSTIELGYVEKDINNNVVATGGTLGTLAADVSGFMLWLWPATPSPALQTSTKYIEFDFSVTGVFDFKATDFATPDFLTT